MDYLEIDGVFISDIFYKIKYEVTSFFERVASVIRYAKFIWRDYNWIESDYTPFLSMIKFKLENMRKFIDYDIIDEEESKKMYEQITEALMYLEAWQADVDINDVNNLEDYHKVYNSRQKYKELFFKALCDNVENWWS